MLVAMDIHKEIKAALNVKVNMPSGGYLFIQQTEALTVIDVNSGKFVSSATQDETILKTNIEAVHEIARQLRLRNIGGMIIIDFIDMLSRADKLAMMEELELALEPDKAKPQVGQLSDLGLVELTRHRQGQSLSEIFTKKCPHCQGSGCSIIDFNFATPTAEGEYRAKAAKLKLPINSGFKKNNKNNRNQQQVQELPQLDAQLSEQPKTEIEVENPSQVAVQETEKREGKKRGSRRNNRRDKKAIAEEVIPTAEVVEVAETTLKPEEEIKPTIPEEVKQEAIAKEEAKVSTETQTEEVTEVVTPTEEVAEEKPKRRPNRGASKAGKAAKKPRTSRAKKSAAKEEVKVEE